MYQIEAALRAHPGKVRVNQEDNFFFLHQIREKSSCQLRQSLTARLQLPPVVFAVFDGMGGLRDGEKASAMAAQFLRQQVQGLHGWNKVDARVLTCWLEGIHRQIQAYGKTEHCAVGTTAVLLVLHRRTVWIANVGDSRAYLLRDGVLQQLSTDHTDWELLQQLGASHRKPSLLQFLGMADEALQPEPSIVKLAPQAGDRYLLCSDGLTDMVSEVAITAILKKQKTAKSCAKLLQRQALDHGGKDNVTILVCNIL